MPRDTRLTLWPDQVAFHPLLSSWAYIHNTKTLDLSYCKQVMSCGLASTTLMTNWLFKKVIPDRDLNRVKSNTTKLKDKTKSKKISCQGPTLFDMQEDQLDDNIHIEALVECIENIEASQDANLMKHMKQLGFFHSIREFLSDNLRNKYCDVLPQRKLITSFDYNEIQSYPVLSLNPNIHQRDRRGIVEDFWDHFSDIIFDFFAKNEDRGCQLTTVLEEIIKNIADHSQADGVVGVDIVTRNETKIMSVLVGDAGPGIYQHLKPILQRRNPKRAAYRGFAEVYREALKNEVSGTGGANNYGCGMSTIVNNSIALKANISVFDQMSRLFLSRLPYISANKFPSHNEIWSTSLRVDGNKPFFYFIECEEPR